MNLGWLFNLSKRYYCVMCMYLYICLQVWGYTCMKVCAHACGGQKLVPSIILDGLSLSPELPTGSLAGQLAPEITPAQYVCGCWRFKWAPSTGRTSVLTLEPFSSPQHWNLARDRMESQLLNDVPSILSWNLQWFPLCVKLLSLCTQCYLLD